MNIFGARKDESDESDSVPEEAKMENSRGVPVTEALANAKEGIKKRGRGRPRGSGNRTKENGDGDGPEVNDAKIMLDKLFDPKMWGPLIAMPADAMLAMSGHEHWNLSGVERETLGVTASTAAQYLGIENPKTLALSLLLVNLAMVYAPRAIKEFAMIKAEREKSAENRLGT